MVRVLKLKTDPADLMKQLEDLPEQLRETAIENLHAVGAIGVSVARSLHSPHVDTGTLDSSIRYEIEEVGPRLILRLLAGGTAYVNPKTGRPCDYAGIIESKWPYLQPALNHVKPLVDEIVSNYVEKLV